MTAQFCGQSKTDQSQPKDQSQPDKPLGEVPKMKSQRFYIRVFLPCF